MQGAGDEVQGAGGDWLTNDWAAANRRLRGTPDLSSGTSASFRAPVPLEAGPLGVGPLEAGPLEGGPVLDLGRPVRRRTTTAGIWLTRAWALAKMGSLAASTWWAMTAVHAHLGAVICAYGAVALFSGVGARWRRRYFGPGQLIEPELYEALGSLLYRVGVVLVLAGGALAMVAPGLRA